MMKKHTQCTTNGLSHNNINNNIVIYRIMMWEVDEKLRIVAHGLTTIDNKSMLLPTV